MEAATILYFVPQRGGAHKHHGAQGKRYDSVTSLRRPREIRRCTRGTNTGLVGSSGAVNTVPGDHDLAPVHRRTAATGKPAEVVASIRLTTSENPKKLHFTGANMELALVVNIVAASEPGRG
ncbi:hypothetical protein HPP92_006858 [Vanilla planifolia]|uniref:Uncharacterized protein n=1 Tax=Vanilla planifolia TaxID=51239 RepID=A0A835RD03_VANPL|nr:hypothetical protein HPP92_007093 [Vanilla planifolia]KAG0489995.1 hypothetical protein HPP92_006858 [Vanilla planifolia]